VVSPQGVTEKQIEAVSSASFAVTANAASLRIIASPAPAAFIVTTYPTTEFENEVVAPASLVLRFNDVPLVRTGFDYDVQQGGVGHYKLDLERARQLARMARKVPPPIDLRTALRQFKADRKPADGAGAPGCHDAACPGSTHGRGCGDGESCQTTARYRGNPAARFLIPVEPGLRARAFPAFSGPAVPAERLNQ
jgi:hypothetical protein